MSQPQPTPQPAPGLHIATIAHEGLLWDAYLDFANDPAQPQSYRGRIRFEQAGGAGDAGAAQTTVIIIEESYEDAVDKARAFDDRALQSLLRSSLPDSE